MAKFTVEIPNLVYWRRQIKCQDACPVHTDARGYVRAIAEGRYRDAYFIARGPNPLASRFAVGYVERLVKLIVDGEVSMNPSPYEH